jgi:hypothetical protein
VRRWTSWYDPTLVTQHGENILTAYDTWAVEELRRTKLVWSGWGSAKELGSSHHRIGDSPWGVRKLEDIDGKKLRLFLLSLLWRAAATTLPEFGSVALPEGHMAELRRMIQSGDPEPLTLYPAQLTQLSTIGHLHNHAPISEFKLVPVLDETPVRRVPVPIFRFYFDGLIVHFDRRALTSEYVASVGNMLVGQEETLLVTTQTFADSYQQLQRLNVQVQAEPPPSSA